MPLDVPSHSTSGTLLGRNQLPLPASTDLSLLRRNSLSNTKPHDLPTLRPNHQRGEGPEKERDGSEKDGKGRRPPSTKRAASREPPPQPEFDFHPENVASITRSNSEDETKDFSIQSPADGSTHQFEVAIPPLFNTITAVSLVNYTVVGVPLDESGHPRHPFLMVNFPDLAAAAGASPSCAGAGLLYRGHPRRPDDLRSDVHVNLPVTGPSSQMEYIPERVLLPEFCHINRFRAVRVTLSDGCGGPVAVSRLYMLLRCYGQGSLGPPPSPSRAPSSLQLAPPASRSSNAAATANVATATLRGDEASIGGGGEDPVAKRSTAAGGGGDGGAGGEGAEDGGVRSGGDRADAGSAQIGRPASASGAAMVSSGAAEEIAAAAVRRFTIGGADDFGHEMPY